MDKLKGIETQMARSKVQLADVQQKFRDGAISPEDAVHESMRALEKVGEAIEEAMKKE